MPVVNIQRVVSCSSEDPKYPAANLLSTDKKKWKCRNVGEKQACVILQLSQQTVINSIDIGNEHSAFVEVLVGNSSAPDDDFEVLLVTSSFMSPMESRDGTNANRVRMFSQDVLLKPTAERKWDRVKIVCTQPFNRHVQYGLTFVVFHSLEAEKPSTNVTSLGRFALRQEEDEDDKISVGSLFARRKESSSSLTVAGPAAIRAATSLPPKPSNTPILLTPGDKRSDSSMSPGMEAVAARRNKVALDKEDDDKLAGRRNGGIETTPSESTSEKKRRPAEEEVQQQEKKKKKQDHRKDNERKPSQSTAGSAQRKPFHQLMEDVVLVISGYQNPTRGEIRSKALQMGAKYKADWDNTSTHLVCAFPNTPKFQQVAGKGKIVRKEWVEDCHSQRKRIPWRRYAMDKREQGKPDSEDEILEETETFQQNDDNDALAADSGSDTDDDIQRLQARDPYGEDTDVDSEEETSQTSSVLPPLPSIFEDKVFHIHESIQPEDRSRLRRYIVAFKGTVSGKMGSHVNFILAVGNASDLTKMKARYPAVVILHPDWVWACNDAGSLAPLSAYKI